MIFLFSFNSLIAQETRNLLIFNIQSHAFIDESEKLDGTFRPINPGSEILYEKQLNKFLSISSGFSYIYSSWKYSIGIKSHFQRIAHELFVPVLLESKLNEKFYINYGIYPGWLLKGAQLYRNNSNIKNWRDQTGTTNYNSSPKTTIDLYLGAGINKPLNEKHSFDFIPFIKYKIKDNWMGEVRSRLGFGIKLNYTYSLVPSFQRDNN